MSNKEQSLEIEADINKYTCSLDIKDKEYTVISYYADDTLIKEEIIQSK